MKKQIFSVLIVTSLIAGCSQQSTILTTQVIPASSQKNTEETQLTGQIIHPELQNMINVNYDASAPWPAAHKYECGDKKFNLDRSITLSPGDKVIGTDYSDVTFSFDCSKVYFSTYSATDSITEYDLKTDKTKVASISNKQFPNEYVLDMTDVPNGQKYYPHIHFIYPLSNNQLFVSFDTPTTGKGLGDIHSLQAIYDIAKNKLDFLSYKTPADKIDFLSPVLFDPTNLTITMPILDTSNQTGTNIITTSKFIFDISSRKGTVITLKNPVIMNMDAYSLCDTDSSIPNIMGEDAQRTNCYEQRYGKLFDTKTK